MRKSFPELERKKLVEVACETLWKHDGQEALKYLREQRGLSDEVIRSFNFGYCPANINHELAGRILMPLYNSMGDLIVLTTRHLDPNSDLPHFHESFEKSNYLYGIHLAKKHILQRKFVIAVEGQFDVAFLHSKGLQNTVGVLGTSLQIQQLSILSRYTSEICVIFDPDKAGKLATARAQEMYKLYCLDKFDIHFTYVKLPEGKDGKKGMDPDDYVREYGVDSLLGLIKDARLGI